MEYCEKIEEWFEKYEKLELKFENLDGKYHPSMQVSTIIFLASKLKDKSERWFLQGEHDILYIGSDLDIFEDFTEEEVEIAVYHDVSLSESGGFVINASM